MNASNTNASMSEDDPWDVDSLLAQLGSVLDDRWVLEEVLGCGGMGAVFKARQLSVDRQVAVKLIRPDIVLSTRITARFLREGRILSTLQHPNIVTLFDVGQDTTTGTLYLVMELLSGEPMDRVQEQRSLRLTDVIELSGQLFSALGAAHSQGIIHRDIKPSNLILEEVASGSLHLTLLDFGVARSERPEDQGLTSTGQIHGTPLYMAPEQVNGIHVTASADLYAAGLIMYRLLSGEDAFEGNSAFDIFVKQVREPPPPLEERWIMETPPHPELIALVNRLLAKSPDDRPASAAEVLAHLHEIRVQFSNAPSAAYVERSALPGPRPEETSGSWPSPQERTTLKKSRAASPHAAGEGATARPQRLAMMTTPEASYAMPGSVSASGGTADPYAEELLHAAPRTPNATVAVALVLLGVLVTGLFMWSIWPKPTDRASPSDNAVNASTSAQTPSTGASEGAGDTLQGAEAKGTAATGPAGEAPKDTLADSAEPRDTPSRPEDPPKDNPEHTDQAIPDTLTGHTKPRHRTTPHRNPTPKNHPPAKKQDDLNKLLNELETR
ncbi:MAG: protein kinase [Myxococcota bacterium]